MEITVPLDGHAGFAVRYDSAENPWFKVGVSEALTKISSVDLGKKLLKLIADATPTNRLGKDGVAFPDGVNVILHPQDNRKFVQSGFKPEFLPDDFSGKKDGMVATPLDAFNIEGKDFTYVGKGSCNENADQAHSSDSQGTVCAVAFDSAQMMTRQGVHTTAFLVLAHELIHSYHGLYGINAGDKEEPWTTGIGEFADEEMSENAFRDVFGMAKRENY